MHGGMVMYVKRLEAGRFKLPEYDPGSNSYPMEWRDLVMIVEGIQENPGQRLRRLLQQKRPCCYSSDEVPKTEHTHPTRTAESTHNDGRNWL
nr:transposase [Parabacteroides sp. ZJ-118]